MPSMGAALVNGCNRESGGASGTEHSESGLIDFRGGVSGFRHIDAGTVLAASKIPGWQANNPLRQADVVLLGGSYRYARDKYVTPIGYLDGVDVLAFSQLRELPNFRDYWYPPFEIVLGMAALWLTWKYRKSKILAWLLPWLMIPAFALTSYLIFVFAGYAWSFVPVLVGVVAEHLFEFYYEHFRLQRNYGELQRKYHRLRAGEHGVLPDSGETEHLAIQIDIQH